MKAYRRKPSVRKTVWTKNKKGQAGGIANSGWTPGDIRKEILKLAETKRFSNNVTTFSSSLPANQYHAYNMLYWIPSGAGESQRLGDEIFIDSFDLGVTVGCDRSTNVVRPQPNQPLLVYCAVVKSNEEIKDGTIGPSTTPVSFPDMRYNGSGSYATPVVDTNRFTVLWSTKINFGSAPLPNVDEQKQIRKRLKVNQKFKFQTTSSGYGKFSNYYLVFACSSPASNQNLALNPNYVVNFKDM